MGWEETKDLVDAETLSSQEVFVFSKYREGAHRSNLRYKELWWKEDSTEEGLGRDSYSLLCRYYIPKETGDDSVNSN